MLWLVEETKCICVTGVSRNLASHNYVLFKRLLAAFPISVKGIYSLHKLSKCCWCRCGCIIFRVWLNDCWNHHFGCLVILSTLTEVGSCVPPAWLRQFVRLHLLLLATLHAILYRFADCTHHPARFIMFAQLAQLCILLIIILIVTILCRIRNCKIAYTTYNRIRHLLKCCFGLSGSHSLLFSNSHIFLLLHNHCLHAINWPSRHSSLRIYRILNALLFLFVAQTIGFLTVSCLQRFVRLEAVQNSSCSDPVWFEAPRASICMMLSSCGVLCKSAEFAASSGELFFFRALITLLSVDFVDWRDVGCCKMRTTWRQAVPFMSRLVWLRNLNKAKSVVSPSLHWE